MLCENCKTALRISRRFVTVSGDSSPETETKVFENLELCCPNKNCRLCGRAKLVQTEMEFEKGEKENG